MDRRNVILSLAGLAAVMASPAAAQQDRSGLTIERFPGRGAGRRPAVLLLHGSDGVTRRERYTAAVQSLVSQGFTVLFPHYLEATGDRRASFLQIGAKYALWAAAVREAIDAASADRAIDPRRLAIVGVSLGGALALSTAARDPRVKAVVSYYGFLPRDISAGAGTPTLILHGARDGLVPVTNADEIEALLRARGGVVEKQIYPDQGHGFAQAAALDAAMRTGAFLRRHLGA